MTNPVSQIPSAQLPHSNMPIVGQDGTANSVFYRFLTGLWQRSGGPAGVNTNDTVQVAQAALTAATDASQKVAITAAKVAVQDVSIDALQLEITAVANTANTALTTAQHAATGVMLQLANLNDVASKPAARANLGVAFLPATFELDTLPSGLKCGMPLLVPVVVPANLNGTNVWWDVPPLADAVFSISSKLRGGLGTLTIAAGGTGVQFSTFAAVSLAANDVLILTTPTPSDANLARVAISVPLLLA